MMLIPGAQRYEIMAAPLGTVLSIQSPVNKLPLEWQATCLSALLPGDNPFRVTPSMRVFCAMWLTSRMAWSVLNYVYALTIRNPQEHVIVLPFLDIFISPAWIFH